VLDRERYGLVNSEITGHIFGRRRWWPHPFLRQSGFIGTRLFPSCRTVCLESIIKPVESEEGSLGSMICDFCVCPYESYAPPYEAKSVTKKRANEQGEVFFWMMEAIMRSDRSRDAESSVAGCARSNGASIHSALDTLVDIGGGNDHTRLYLRFHLHWDIYLGDYADKPFMPVGSQESKRRRLRSQKHDDFGREVHDAIIDLISTRLYLDMRTLKQHSQHLCALRNTLQVIH
jgi:hypothetical protein